MTVEEATPYGAADADMTLRLVPPLQAEIKEKGLEKILELEMPLVEVLSDMEQAGVRLDIEFFRANVTRFTAAISRIGSGDP